MYLQTYIKFMIFAKTYNVFLHFFQQWNSHPPLPKLEIWSDEKCAYGASCREFNIPDKFFLNTK